MRNVITSCVIVILSMTLVLLVAVPQQTLSQDPLTIAKGAVSVLGPFVKNYLADLRAKREAEKIKARLWMHNGDPQLNGCGFYFQVNGYSGGFGSGYFPRKVIHKCGANEYEMRMTSQSALYDKQIHLGNEQARQIELHADGWHNTFVNVLCIGMNERTIAGGPRAFCINNNLLKGCKSLMKKWDDVNIDFNDILLTRTSRGAHKIIFRDIGNLVNGFERLARNPDDTDAVWTVCDRIDLVRGTDSDNNWQCSARRAWTESTGAGNFFSWQTRYRDEDKSPFGCQRFTNKK